MLFQLETKNVETGVVYKSPLYASFAEARDEARAVSMAGRRTVRVVQVTQPDPTTMANCRACFMNDCERHCICTDMSCDSCNYLYTEGA